MDLLLFLGLFLLSLLPGVVGAVRNLRLDPQADDDTLLAQRLSGRPWSAFALWISIFGIIIAASHRPALYLFLIPMLLGVFFAAWDSRRRLLGERWSFPGFLFFHTRFFVGLLAPPILLLVTPTLVDAAPRPRIAGLIAATLLLVIFHAYHRILPWVVGTVPWQPHEALAERFAAIEARARCEPRPRTRQIQVGRGLIHNAFAIPHPKHPGVLYTSALVDDFPDDQIAGIHAHEVSHLEQFRRPRIVWTLEILTLLLIAAASFGVPVLAADVETGWLVHILWIALVFGLLILRARWIHGLESQADRRAVELLGGDGESLATGLEQLHRRQRMPRRLAPEVERKLTHPSLARRLQAIRRLSGRVAERPKEDGVFVSPAGDSALVFGPQRLHLLSGIPAGSDGAQGTGEPTDADGLRRMAQSTRSDSYGLYSDLRFTRDRKGLPQISAVGSDGLSWSQPIREVDVGRAGSWLDAVDGELAEAPRQPVSGPKLWRLLAVLCILLTIPTFGAWPAVAWTGLLVLATGHRAAAAACAGAVVGSLFVLFTGVGPGMAYPPAASLIAAAMLAGAVILFLVGALPRSSDAAESSSGLRTGLSVAACLLAALVAHGLLLLAARPSRDLATSVFAWSDGLAGLPSAWILLLATAFGLAVHARRSVRAIAVVLAALSLAMAVLSLLPVRQFLVPDPLVGNASSPGSGEAPPVHLREVHRWNVGLPADASQAYPSFPIELRLAPEARWAAVYQWHGSENFDLDTDYSGEYRWRIAPRDGPLKSGGFEADGLHFLAQDVAVLHRQTPTPGLIRLDLASGEQADLGLPGELFDFLTDSDGSWHLAGVEWRHGEGADIVRLSGGADAFDDGEFLRTAVSFDDVSDAEVDVLPTDWTFLERRLVSQETRWRTSGLAVYGTLSAMALGVQPNLGTVVVEQALPPTGRPRPVLSTRLDLDCPAQIPSGRDLFCLAKDRGLTRLVRIGLGDDRNPSPQAPADVEILAVMEGALWQLDLQYAADWILLSTESRSLLWHRAGRKVYRLIDEIDLPELALALASSGESALLGSVDHHGSLVVYELLHEPARDLASEPTSPADTLDAATAP